MKEVEISIVGLIFYILKHWKSIVIGSLLCALVLLVFKNAVFFLKPQAVSTHDLGELLSDDEKAYVESIFEYVENLRIANGNRDDSFLLGLDAQELTKTKVTYLIQVENPEDLEAIDQIYRSLFTASECLGYIADKTDISVDDVSRIINLADERVRTFSSSTVLSIVIYSDDKKRSEKIVDSLDEFLVEKSHALITEGLVHDLVLINNSTFIGADQDILSRQNQILREKYSDYKTIIDVESSLDTTQKEYYDSLAEHQEVLENEDDTQLSDSNTNSSFPIIDKKSIVIGLVLGFLVLCSYHFAIYLFGNKLAEEDDVERLFGISSLGIITGSDYGKPLYRLRNLGKRTFDYEESVKILSARISMLIRSDKSGKIGIVGCGMMKNSEKAVKELVGILKERGIEVVVVDDPLYDSSSVEVLGGLDSVVLLEKIGATFRTEILKETELLQKMGIKVEGLVMAE